LYYAALGVITVHQEIPFDQLNVSKLPLGQGVSATVYKGTWKGKDVAVKVFDPMGLYFNLEELKKEMALAYIMENSNIVGCYGGSLGPKYYMVMEYIEKGTLKQMYAHSGQVLDLNFVLQRSYEIAKAMEFLMEYDIVHRYHFVWCNC
jgi:serine/threonine protein kinase